MATPSGTPGKRYELPPVQGPHRTPIVPLMSPQAQAAREERPITPWRRDDLVDSMKGSSGWFPGQAMVGLPEESESQVEEEQEVEDEGVQYSCYSFDRDSFIRSVCLTMINSPYFDQVSMFVICLNCITLALYDPMDPDCETTKCQVVTGFDLAFTVFFFVEMCIKIVAMGCWGHSTAYLADPWNRMDGTIAIIGMLDLLPFMDTASVKAFRAVRPLRAVNRFPELRVLIKLLLNTLPMLASVALLCFFIFFVFGILAVQLWNGVLRQRCFESGGVVFYDPNELNSLSTDVPTGGDGPYVCTMTSEQQDGINSCPPASSHLAYANCIKNTGDSHDANPFWGSIHFDNIFGAWVAIFQCITLEAWVDIMYLIQGGYSFHAWMYFVTLIVVGAFFAVNLTLVVISAQFAATKSAELEELGDDLQKQEEEAYQNHLETLGHKTRGWWTVIRTCGSQSRHYIDNKLQEHGLKMLEVHREAIALDDEDPRKAELVAEEEKLKIELKELTGESDQDQDIKELEGCSKWRMLFKLMVTSDKFNNTIMVVILANVIVMATQYHGQPQSKDDVEAILNIVFCAIFLLEMIFKLFGLGLNGYVKDGFNCFDGIIVILSTVELFAGSSSGLSVLRTFRLIRVFKLVRFLPSLQQQLAVMFNTLTEIISFLVLLFLFMFIYAILGMFLFGNKFKFDGSTTSARKNFDTFHWAITTVFQILTQEDWNIVMYQGVRACGFTYSLYFISLIVLGNYILFNLFVAILIDGFGDEKEEDAVDAVLGDNAEDADTSKEGTPRSRLDKGGLQRRISRIAVAQISGVQSVEEPGSRQSSDLIKSKESQAKPRWKHSDQIEAADSSIPGMPQGVGTGHEQNGVGTLASPHEEASSSDTAQVSAPSTQEHSIEGSDAESSSSCTDRDLALCCFVHDSFPRAQCLKLIKLKAFDNFIMAIILLNSVALAWERPDICEGSAERVILNAAGHFFNAIFVLEMVTKVIALGFFCGPNPYWADGWNRLDGFIVTVSVVDFVFSVAGIEGGGILGLLKIFRMLRALRPLRAVNKMPGLKKVVNTLMESIVPIGSTLIIVLAFFLIFGILGLQLLAGKLWHCEATDSLSADQISEIVVTKADCIANGGNWVNTKYNYDHLGEALMTLFVLSSIDGWVDIMYEGIDAVDVDKQPIENHNEIMILFYIVFLLVGGFFILNMFVGVIVENFQKQQELYAQETANMPPEEDSEVDKPEPEDKFYEELGPFRRATYDLCVSTRFEAIIAVVIILNIVVMASEHWNMSSGFELFLKITNYIFTIIFIFESGAKLVGFGIIRFFCGSQQSCGWNNFDLFVVATSILGIVMDELGTDNLPINPTLLRVLRILRIARILKLLKSAKDLMTLLETVKRSLAQVGNLALLLFLLFFIFAALGIELFGRLDCSDDNPCDGFDMDLANFKNFGMAMLVLFRISTGDNWNGMLKDAIRTTGTECGDDASDKCQSGCYSSMAVKIAPFYFIAFVLCAQFVMLNLVVAVLMQELESSENDPELKHPEDVALPQMNAKVAPEPETLDDEFNLGSKADNHTPDGTNKGHQEQEQEQDKADTEAPETSPVQMMQTGQTTLSSQQGQHRALPPGRKVPRELPPI